MGLVVVRMLEMWWHCLEGVLQLLQEWIDHHKLEYLLRVSGRAGSDILCFHFHLSYTPTSKNSMPNAFLRIFPSRSSPSNYLPWKLHHGGCRVICWRPGCAGPPKVPTNYLFIPSHLRGHVLYWAKSVPVEILLTERSLIISLPLLVPSCPWPDMALVFEIGLSPHKDHTVSLIITDCLFKIVHLIPLIQLLADWGPQFTFQFWKTFCREPRASRPHLLLSPLGQRTAQTC